YACVGGRDGLEIARPHVTAEALYRMPRCLAAVVDADGHPPPPTRDYQEKARAAADVEQPARRTVSLAGGQPGFVRLHRWVRGPGVEAVGVVAGQLGHDALARRMQTGEERTDLRGARQRMQVCLTALPADDHGELPQLIEQISRRAAAD